MQPDYTSTTYPDLSKFVAECYALPEAQRLVRMTRTGFYRFRIASEIKTLTGRRVYGADIVRALERARGQSGNGPWLSLHDYAAKLLTCHDVCAKFGFGLTSFYKLRIQHRIPLLPGGTFHCDDIVATLDAEREGKRRVISLQPPRIVTRNHKTPRPARLTA